MKVIFVIGANSALAKVVIKTLSLNNRVITGGRKSCDVYCDITKKVDIPQGVDVVINFAAVFGRESDQEIEEAYKTNTAGILNICTALKLRGVKHFINISSLSAVLNENSPYYTAYAITKRQGDELAQYYCKLNNISLTILRPSQVYGDSLDFSKNQSFIYETIKRAKNGEDIQIYGSRDPLRNYIHSIDLAEIISVVVSSGTTGVYQCSGEDITFSQVASTAQRLYGKGGNISYLDEKPDIPDNVFKEDNALYDIIGHYPVITIEGGLKRIKSQEG